MTHYDSSIHQRWITVGIVCGFATMIVYPAIIFIDLPTPLGIFLAASFGFLFALASIGLKTILELDRPSVGAQIGALANIIGGAVVAAMMLIQVAVNSHMHTLMDATAAGITKDTYRQVWLAIDKIQLALDVTWDYFGGIGTVLLAFAAARHPRFGWWFAAPGIILGVALLILNCWTFPTPPAEGGLFDLGPFVALWYLVMMIRSVLSLKWIRLRLQEMASASDSK